MAKPPTPPATRPPTWFRWFTSSPLYRTRGSQAPSHSPSSEDKVSKGTSSVVMLMLLCKAEPSTKPANPPPNMEATRTSARSLAKAPAPAAAPVNRKSMKSPSAIRSLSTFKKDASPVAASDAVAPPASSPPHCWVALTSENLAWLSAGSHAPFHRPSAAKPPIR